MGTLVRETNPWIGSSLKTGKGLVAKVWSGTDTLSRSPKESPPVEKKRLRRLQNTWLYQQRAPLASLDDALIADNAPEDTRSNLSTDSATSHKRSQSLPRSIIKSHGTFGRSHRNGSVSAPRRVVFNPKVTVEYMDDEKHIKTEQEDLVVKPRDRQVFMSRNLSRIAQNQRQQIQAPYQFNMYDEDVENYQSSSPPHLNATLECNKNTLLLNAQNDGSNLGNVGSTVDSTSTTKPQVNIYFIPHNQGTKMKMVVNIGAAFHPDDICVKANMSGNKVRVMASKVIQGADGTINTEPINERFLLPMEVDPYAVEARLDTKGNLTIEAPLMTQEKRALLKQNASQAGVSL